MNTEQITGETLEMTGYPSIDKPWLRFYMPGAEERAINTPEQKTVWDVVEERLLEHKSIPAIEYFGRTISRPEFIDMVYTWARAFKALGIEENEVVPYYGPFFPDVGAMAFAMNIIGACPYFLKLAISSEALEEETKKSRFAIVFNDMWANVASEFCKERFEKIIVVSATDAMPSPMKQIVSLLAKFKSDKNKQDVPKEDRFIGLDKAKKFASRYQGEVRTPYTIDRPAFITSSSGTTVGGIVKGCVATNESTVAQLIMEDVAEVSYFPNDRVLNHFPPTASTSLNSLFLVPLYRGATVVMDPRVTEEDFYNQITKLRPNVVIHTGSAWEAFFTRIEREQQEGKQFDFSFATGWIVGGEGTCVDKFLKWKGIIDKANGSDILVSGYGASELFSAAVGEQSFARCPFEKQIISVGIPYAGMNIGVFDDQGRELGYNQRGELWIQSKTAMKEYFNKPELTAQTKIDGWIHSGDLAEIDNKGFVYIWGRLKDTVKLPSGEEVYLFDIAHKIDESNLVDDVVVLSMPKEDGGFYLVAHIAWSKQLDDQSKADCLVRFNELVEGSFPAGIRISAYAEYEHMLPCSPTTLKKDKNKMSNKTTGYIQVIDGQLKGIRFEATGESAFKLQIL